MTSYSLTSSKRIEIKPGAVGTVTTKEDVVTQGEIFAIMDIRNSFGRKSLFLTSSIIRPDHTGPVELHIANHSLDLIEIKEGEEIANLVYVRSAKSPMAEITDLNQKTREAMAGLQPMVPTLIYSTSNLKISLTKTRKDFEYTINMEGDFINSSVTVVGMEAVVNIVSGNIRAAKMGLNDA